VGQTFDWDPSKVLLVLCANYVGTWTTLQFSDAHSRTLKWIGFRT